LYEASLDADWLCWAEVLQEQQDRLFWDSKGSGYFTSPENDTSILIRGKEGIKVATTPKNNFGASEKIFLNLVSYIFVQSVEIFNLIIFNINLYVKSATAIAYRSLQRVGVDDVEQKIKK
jgi:hypothetical protein